MTQVSASQISGWTGLARRFGTSLYDLLEKVAGQCPVLEIPIVQRNRLYFILACKHHSIAREINMSSPTHVNKPKILSSGALFSTLDGNELEIFAQFASTESFNAGTVVCCEGSEGDAMYVIATGSVRITLSTTGGKAAPVGTLGQGDTFGEISLLDGKKRTATAETLEPSELLSIKREDLLGCLQKQPLIAIKLLAALAGRLRMTDELIADTFALKLPSRLTKALINLAKAYGYNTESGIKIDVNLYEEELAYRLGIPKEKIGAQIDEWIEQGLLKIRKYRLVILDPYRLAMLV